MRPTRCALAIILLLLAAVPRAEGASARSSYNGATTQEQAVRRGLEAPRPTPETRTAARRLVARYERLASRYRGSGYADNALWQAANLAADVWRTFGDAVDREAALRLYKRLAADYPHSSLVPKARLAFREVQAARTVSARAGTAAPPTARPVVPRTSEAPAARATSGTAAPVATAPAAAGDRDDESATFPLERVIPVPEAAPVATRTVPEYIGPALVPGAEPALIRSIKRSVLPEAERVVIELDREVAYHEERIANPDRVFLDLRGVKVGTGVPATQRFDAATVRQIRLGPRPEQTTRVVLHLGAAGRYSVFTLYNPYRVVIDCERPGAPPANAVAASRAAAAAEPPLEPDTAMTPKPVILAPGPGVTKTAPLADPLPGDLPEPLAGRTALPPSPPLSGPPAANLQGRFSLSRQLGLGIGRVVIDAGHGGQDPGAQIKGLDEADLVLDIALRLERLLLKQPGVEVVLTRRTDVFIPLEERTAIANREGADLFLSIHANASRNQKARGIETYFLNFASNPEAEAVAARENAASGRTMHSLPDIVKAITLNNKLDESRDFATMVQRTMVERLSGANKQVRDLGVKQAPFVVLIGASMPSILAEISFITNPHEGRLLKTPAYRQRIAEALLEGVMKYQRSLKSVRTVATQD